MGERKKVFIIDDNKDLLNLMGSLLEEKYKLNLRSSAENIQMHLDQFKPDLIILDIGLPYRSGYEVCTEIKSMSEFSNTPIIFVTAMSGASARTMGYKLGAINFIEKPFENSELVAVIASVLKTALAYEDRTILCGDLSLETSKREVRLGRDRIKLTKSEAQILFLFMKYPGRVFSRDYLYESIRHKSENSSLRTVDTHVSSIRKKIYESDVSLESIYGEGYSLSVEKHTS